MLLLYCPCYLRQLPKAEKRLAVLLGNESYRAEVGQLSNPHTDTAILKDLRIEGERDTAGAIGHLS